MFQAPDNWLEWSLRFANRSKLATAAAKGGPAEHCQDNSYSRRYRQPRPCFHLLPFMLQFSRSPQRCYEQLGIRLVYRWQGSLDGRNEDLSLCGSEPGSEVDSPEFSILQKVGGERIDICRRHLAGHWG